MTKQEQAYQAKIEKAMTTIRERDGYCTVASASEPTVHIVFVNEHLYSTESKQGLDCYHRIAVDRYYDDRRPSFHQRHGLVVAQAEAIAARAERAASQREAYCNEFAIYA